MVMMPEWENCEVISSEDVSIGQVSGVVWEDAAGFQVVAVGEVVIPVKAEEPREKVVVEYSTAQVQSGPLLNELAEYGGEAAVEMISEHYNVPLSGPPPGPSPQPLPPWWKKRRGAESEPPTIIEG
jgi:hypothetical protein